MKEALTIKKLFKFFSLLKTEEVRVVEGRGKANFLTRLQPRKSSWSSLATHIQKSEMFPVTSQRTKEEKLCVCKPVDFFKYIPKKARKKP